VDDLAALKNLLYADVGIWMSVVPVSTMAEPEPKLEPEYMMAETLMPQ
jgi:hypothetical protein